MTVLVVAGDIDGHETILCVICLQHVPFPEVTAGSLYADGHQAFACNKHLHDRTRWITEWASFDAAQRRLKAVAEDTL